jgi:predicted TIM-barrel fold metal-dependent hydrolase
LERVTRVFRAANARGMAIVVHMHPSVTMNRPYGTNYARLFLTELVGAAPDVPIQIAHLTSSGNIDEPAVDSALALFVKAIADGDPRMKNVYFDISGLGEIAGTPERATRVVTRLRQLGLNRILFGSDGAVMGNSPLVSWTAIRKLPLTAEEFDVIASNVPPYMR